MDANESTDGMRRGRPAVGVVALALLFSLGAPVTSPGYAAENTPEKFQAGDKAPDFTLQDLAGARVSLSSFAGKQVVVLSFFSLRCGSCLAEAPHLEQLHKKYGGGGVVLLSVNTDGVNASTASEIMKEVEFPATYTVLLDPDFTATDTYTNFVVPLTLVIDRGGIIRYIHTGFEEGMEKAYEKAVLKAVGS